MRTAKGLIFRAKGSVDRMQGLGLGCRFRIKG